MPCSDIAETLRLFLNAEDRLRSYRLIKRTCGRAVGEESLLEGELAGLAAADILAIGADEFADARPPHADETVLFLELKHLFAVQSGLRALLGQSPAGADDPVRVARVFSEGDDVVLECDIAIDAITEQIRACGRCSGCAVKRK